MSGPVIERSWSTVLRICSPPELASGTITWRACPSWLAIGGEIGVTTPATWANRPASVVARCRSASVMPLGRS